MAVMVVAVGGSAGAVEALESLVAGFPADLDAAVLVTVHIPATSRSALPRILTRAGPLPAAHAEDGAPVARGTILVAPPDRHLLVHAGRVRLGGGPRVNRHRPSVDVMFTSAARWAGPDLLAVVLSGALDDGAVGAALAARAGARIFVQSDARFAGMPRAAGMAAPDATAVPLAELATVLTTAVRRRQAPAAHHVADGGGTTMNMAESGDPLFLSADESRLTRMACPECGGSLAQIDLPTISYYRCHVGHQWSPESLVDAQADAAEAKLWAAVATLEEEAALRRHLAENRTGLTPDRAAADLDHAGRHLRGAQRATALARLIRDRLNRTDAET